MTKSEAKTRAQEIAETVFDRAGKKSKVSISSVTTERQGNFVFVSVAGNFGRRKLFSAGVAKCNPCDSFNINTGFNLAVQRAVHKVL